MKVIFLDFNGVLDTYDNFDEIDLNNLYILVDAINLTDAKVVITSSNKNYFYRMDSDVEEYAQDILIPSGYVETLGNEKKLLVLGR